FAGKKSAQIREILISESAWEEMTCLFAPSLVQQSQSEIFTLFQTRELVEQQYKFAIFQQYDPRHY
ncbi:TPA: hypothetical protein ACMEXW_004744, partial [Klebsiella pneumoniae]